MWYPPYTALPPLKKVGLNLRTFQGFVCPYFQGLSFSGRVPIGSMGQVVYLPTLEIHAYGKCRQKNTSWILWGFQLGALTRKHPKQKLGLWICDMIQRLPSLKLTAKTPENGWWENPIFRGKLLVSGRVNGYKVPLTYMDTSLLHDKSKSRPTMYTCISL